MKAIAIVPGTAGPGGRAQASDGQKELVIGHEVFGQVVRRELHGAAGWFIPQPDARR